MRFDYKRYRTADDKAFERPVIPMYVFNPQAPLHYPTRGIMCEALVDSGSDYTIFPSVIGEIIGIDIEAGKRELISGVVAEESRPIYFHNLQLSIEVGRRFEARVAFMPDLSQTGHGILGQDSFFSALSYVKFQTDKRLLHLGRVIV
jgi:hypothetical protein